MFFIDRFGVGAKQLFYSLRKFLAFKTAVFYNLNSVVIGIHQEMKVIGH
jgi:hypothetical protein